MPAIENIDELMKWLSKKLEPICDADPNALAKYVVALTKKDKSTEELKATCIDQLGVFLVNETEAFVEDLFEAIATKSYIPGGSANNAAVVDSSKQEPPPQPAAPAPAGADLPIGAETTTKEDGRSRSTNRDTLDNEDRDHRRSRRHSHSKSRSRSHSPSRNRSRSRSYSPRRRRRDEDRRRRDDRLDRYGPSRRYGDRDRDRDRERMRDRDYRDRDRDRDRDRMRNRDGRDSGRYDDRGRNRDRDDRERDRDDRLKDISGSSKSSAVSSVITVVSNDGPEPAQGSSKQGDQLPQRIRQRCRDYDEKGFCMKGEFCPYDHGNDPVVVEDIDMFRPPPNMDSRPPVPSLPPAPQPPLPPLPPSQPPPPILPPFGIPPPPGFPPPPGGAPLPLLPPVRMHGPNGPPPGPPPGLPPHMRFADTSQRPPLPPPIPIQMNRPPPPLPPAPDAAIPPSVPQPPPSSPPRETSPPPPPSEPKTTQSYGSSQDFQMEGYNPEDPSMEPHSMEDHSMDTQPDRPYFGGGRQPRQASSNLRTLVGIQTVPTTTREEIEELSALTKDSSSENEIERKVVDLTQNQSDVRSQEDHQPQRRAVIKNNDGPVGYGGGPGLTGGAGGPAVDLRARIGGKGKGRFVPNNRILEVRKIPKEFNNISKLNEHFSKFGNIVNLQIAYAQDLEAALVTFSTHLEAKKAYQSTEAVFNNRFVKVFWHIPPENTASENETSQPTRKPKQRIQLPSKKQLTVVRNHPTPQDKIAQPGNPTLTKTIINQNAVAINQRLVTVQNNLANAKKAAAAHNSATVAKKLAAAQEAVRKKQEEAKKLVAKKQLELRKQKQELMNGFIQQQKMLIMKLEQNKATITTLKRAEIMESIKMLTANIEKTKKELMDVKPKPKDKKQTERELLDSEMDLYNQQSEGGDTSELRKRVDDLRREAQALGLLDGAGSSRGRGHPRSIRGRGGRGRGRGFVTARRRSSNTKLVVDKRPRGLVVGGFSPEDKDEVLIHFTNYGEIENVEYNEDSCTYVLEFKTRLEAEMAVAKGNQFKGNSLSLAWHKNPDLTVEMVENSMDAGEEMEDEEEEEIEDELDDDLLLVDDEEDDDEEGRSWKR